MRGQSLAVFLFFLLLSAAMTYPLVLHFSTAVSNLGDPLFNAWVLAWGHHQLFADPLHFFDANIFYPHRLSLAYSEHLFASALLSLPVAWLGGSPVAAANFVLLASFALCGWGMFLLARELTGNAAAAVLAGMAFAFSSYRFSQLSHLQILTAQWMPFALLYLHRAFGGAPSWKNFLLFGLFLLLQALSCNYLAVFFFLAVVIWIVGMLPARWRAVGWSGAGKLAATFALVGALFLPFILPYYAVQNEHRFARELHDVKRYCATAENYLAVPGKHRFYPAALKKLAGPERALFLGFTAMGLALLAFFFRDEKWALSRRIYLVILFLAFLLSMGIRSKLFGLSLHGQPYRFLYYWLPGFDGMRVPARFAVIVGLALAVLAGIGAAGCLNRLRRPVAAAAAAGILGLAILADGWCVPIGFAELENNSPPVQVWLRDRPDVQAVVHLPMYKNSVAYKEMNHVFWSAQNWKKMVNGYSGFFPPGYEQMTEEMSPFPSQETLEALRRIKVNYVVLHRDQYEEQAWRKMEMKLKNFSAELEPVKITDSAWVLRVREKKS